MDKTLLICAAIAAWIIIRSAQQTSADGMQDEDMIDTAQTTLDEAMNTISETFSGPGQIAGMRTSESMLDMLRRREKLMLTPYNLGDGGWTIGYGHFEKTLEALPAISSAADAEALFAIDVQERGEKWVKLYVEVPLTQYQFDALVSIAFNMSPQSFKKFAVSVNNGEGIDAIAQRSVSWVADTFKNGIANRRTAELNVFNNGVYA
jgi:lysozyme